jgi:hypothetical protein
LDLFGFVFTREDGGVEEEFAEDEAYGPNVDGFFVLAGAEEEFWGAVPNIKADLNVSCTRL